MRRLAQVTEFDENLSGLYASLSDVDALLSDFNRELSSYLNDFSFSQEEFLQLEERLNLITT